MAINKSQGHIIRQLHMIGGLFSILNEAQCHWIEINSTFPAEKEMSLC